MCLMLAAMATMPRELGGLEGRVVLFDTERKFSSTRYCMPYCMVPHCTVWHCMPYCVVHPVHCMGYCMMCGRYVVVMVLEG